MITRIQVIEKINANLIGNKQVSDRSITETVEALFATVTEETDLEAFSTIATNVCKTMGGQILNEVSTKIAEAKAAEPKPPTAEELAAQKVIDDAKAAELLAEPAWAKANRIAQEERFAAMEAKLTGADIAKTTEQRKADAIAQMKLTYSPEFVDANANYFDFSKEDASVGFAKMCTDLGASQGITPLSNTGGAIAKPDFSAEAERLGLGK